MLLSTVLGSGCSGCASLQVKLLIRSPVKLQLMLSWAVCEEAWLV